jgi:chromosome segregation ATPase
MIHKHFLKEANRIRSKYLSTIEKFQKKEDYIKENKIIIEKLINNINNAVDNSDSDIKDDVKEELLDIETTIYKIQKEVIILDKELKKLKKDSNILFSKIQKHHPDLREEEIQKEIFYALEK